jgi:hypothetical protein
MKYLFLGLLTVFVAACTGVEEPEPVIPGAEIDGKVYELSVVRIVHNGEHLSLQMLSGSHSLNFITSDTITGRYLIDTINFKSSVVFRAQLTYRNGSDTYIGRSGKLDLELENGLYSGNFESVVQSDKGVRIVIRNGIFEDVLSSPGS